MVRNKLVRKLSLVLCAAMTATSIITPVYAADMSGIEVENPDDSSGGGEGAVTPVDTTTPTEQQGEQQQQNDTDSGQSDAPSDEGTGGQGTGEGNTSGSDAPAGDSGVEVEDLTLSVMVDGTKAGEYDPSSDGSSVQKIFGYIESESGINGSVYSVINGNRSPYSTDKAWSDVSDNWASGASFEWLDISNTDVSVNGLAKISYNSDKKEIDVDIEDDVPSTLFYYPTLGEFAEGGLFSIDGYPGDVVDIENSWLPELTGGEYEPFLGWYSEEPQSDASYRPSEDSKVTGSYTFTDSDMELYAAWTLPEATMIDVVFHANYDGADPESTTLSVEANGDSYSVPVAKMPTFSREGYGLTYFQNSDGSIILTPGTPAPTSVTEWFAVWAEQSTSEALTITYVIRDESVDSEVESGDLVGLTIPYDFEENNLIYDGMFWDSDYTQPVEDGATIGEENLTVYIRTVAVGSISLDPSDTDGTLGLESESYDYVLGFSIADQAQFADTEYNLISQLPTLTAEDGSEFLGWTDEEGNDVTAETVFGEDADPITLYAKWNRAEVQVYTLTFDLNGGAFVMDGASNTATIMPGDPATGFPEVAKENATFTGWNTAADGSGTSIEEGFIPEGDMTIYAQYDSVAVAVTFDPNGGTFDEGVEGMVEVNAGSAIGTLPADPVRSGYTFDGWFTGSTDGDAVTADTVVTESATYYAHWTLVPVEADSVVTEAWFSSDEYTVTQGDTEALAQIQVRWSPDNASDADFVYASNDTSILTTSDGSAFDGFGESVGDVLVTATNTAGIKAEATVHVVEKDAPEVPDDPSIVYTITFDAAGGSACEDMTGVAGTVITLPTSEREGYTLLGWLDNYGESVSNEYTIKADATLYADWQEGEVVPEVKQFTVTFDANGGSACEAATVEEGKSVAMPETTREGYTFDGWFDGETKVEGEYTPTDDVTLTAHWTEIPVEPEKKQFTVTFDAAGGDNVDAVTVEEGQSITIPGATREGYTFDGWFDGETKVEGSYTPSSDITLTAHWTEIPAEPEKQQFTIRFNTDGGSACEPVTVEEGTGVTLPETTKDGYTFDGWFNEAGTKMSNGFVPESDLALTAHWTKADEPIETKQFTITFNADGGSECEAVVVNEGEGVVLPSTSRDGYTFDGWFDGETKVEGEYVATADVTLTAHWTENPVDPEKKQFTVSFNSDGGSECEAVTAEEGSSVALPETTKDGYTFDGWFDGEGNKAVSPYIVSADVTLTAHWTEIPVEPEKKQFTVTFDAAGGSECAAVTVENGNSVTMPETTREGYTFDGWFDGDTKITGEYIPAKDITLTAHWTEIPVEPEKKQFTVTFNSSGGTVVDAAVVEEGGSVELPAVTREGYTFDGWYDTEGTKQASPYTPSADITLYARWIEDPIPHTEVYTVTFDAQNGNNPVSVEVNKGDAVETLPEVSREGYTLVGWTDADNKAVTVPFVPEKDMTVYAQWTEVPATAGYNLIVNANGGTFMDGTSVYAPDVKLEEGSSVWNSVSTLSPSRTGYDFAGYYDANDVFVYDVNGTAVDSIYFNNGVFIGSADLTVYAKWTKVLTQYTLTYDANGGSEVAAVKYDSGVTVNGFSETTREGYTFLGWFTEKDGGEQVTSLVMNADKTLYAHWQESKPDDPKPSVWHIYYDTNGGEPLDPDVFEANMTVTTFKTAVREGYEFLGWFQEKDSGTRHITSMTRHSDITVYAHWRIANYTITYDLNGGMLNGKSGKVTVAGDYGTKIILPAPTRDGYVFDYWEGSRYNAGDEYTILEDHTLKAIWKEAPQAVSYVLTFDSNGGTISTSSAEYAEGTVVDAGSFPVPTREGYTFDGWFTEKDGGEKVTSITMDADKTVYGHWTEVEKPGDDDKSYTLTFDANGGDVATSSITEKKGTRITADMFPKPTRNGYRFIGWYTAATDGQKVTAVNMLMDVTLYAHWQKIYVVTFDYQDGARKESYEADEGTVLQSYFADASRDGYTFLGWFDAPSGGTKTTSYKVVGDKTFYAQWKASSGEEPSSDVKAQSLTLSDHTLAVTKGDRINLSYTLLPENTTNKSLSWTTSDSNVVSISLTGNNQIRFDAVGIGEATIRVATKDGSNLSDTCTITVKKADSTDSGSGSGSGSGTTPTPVTPTNSTPTESEVSSYTLMITGATGTVQKVQVNSDITLGKLANALKYTSVAKWTVKQANVAEYEVSENITMKELAALLKNGDVLIIAYGSDGKAIGSAKVEKVSESEMKVTLSKDTNVALKSASEASEAGVTADSKGKGETPEKKTEEGPGKQDEVAPVTPTGDTFAYLVYGILGTLLVLAGGIYLFMRRRASR